MLLGVVDGRQGNSHGLLRRIAREPLGPRLRGHRLQLLNCRRAVHVAADGQHFLFALLNQMLGQLGRRCGLTRALQACHQNHSGRLRVQVDVRYAQSHRGNQLLVDHTDQRLTWRERPHHLLPQRLFFNPRHKIPHHRQGYIGL